jgi:hypothetical protein
MYEAANCRYLSRVLALILPAYHALGCLCLYPQDLATALGRSVHSLCNSGNINALEALMPEPFGLLHRSLLATQLPTVVSDVSPFDSKQQHVHRLVWPTNDNPWP